MRGIDRGGKGSPRVNAGWSLVGVFTLSIFLSATLLFSVQPLFAKLTLPLLGGAPNVWNTAMVFFQGTLLAGYLYAHLISKYLEFRLQVVIHCLILLAGVLFLPLSISTGWEPPSGGAQAFWLIALYGVSIGVPFFAISANAPLLQRWFSRTTHKDSDDPYFLYAASNAGSLLSLAAYPVLIEPLLRLQSQTTIWSGGYILLIGAIVLCGVFVVKTLKPQKSEVEVKNGISPPIEMQRRLMWIFLAFIPSSLMLGITAFMTTNIASAPFLWVLPLSLYLMTFIFVFAKRPFLTPARLRRIYPIAIIGAILAGYVLHHFQLLAISISLICYFVISLMCHGRLAENRPPADRLTEFYIFMSVGGVFGGIFNALIAPVIFEMVFEYLVVLILAFFALPSPDGKFSDDSRRALTVSIWAIAALLAYTILNVMGAGFRITMLLSAGIALVGIALTRDDKRKSIIDFAILTIGIIAYPIFAPPQILTDRSFFGVTRVTQITSEKGLVHRFSHGDTIHNFQYRETELQKIPLAYYANGGTFDQAVKAARRDGASVNVAMIGLGAGAMACYEQPGDVWTYYEIDPAIVEMALNPDYFSYLSECSAEKTIEIGDARLKIRSLPDGSQDIIVVDAFSSDAIPVHLVTKEALDLYLSKLKPEGLIFFHTSNRSMDISSVVGKLADAAALESRLLIYSPDENTPNLRFVTASSGVIVGSETAIESARLSKDWTTFLPSPEVGVWTDDYSHILGTILAHKRNGGQPVQGPP